MDSSSRTLPVAVATIALLYNLTFAAVCLYLPKDPLYLGQSISFYAWAGVALSVIGIIGIAKVRCQRPRIIERILTPSQRQSTLIISFAHYLLLDTFVSAFCRLFVLQLFFDEFSDQDICSGILAKSWQPDAMRNETVAGMSWQQDMRRPRMHARRCRMALDAAQIILFGFLIASTAAQCMLAIGMRRYGRGLEQVTSTSPQTLPSEKTMIVEKIELV